MFDEAVPANGRTDTASSFASSLLLHALLAVAIVNAWTAAPPPLPIEESIPVTLLTPADLDALLHPARPASAPEPPARSTPEASQALTHATAMFSALALAEPRNRKAREALPHLNPTERMIQLCNIEALEQVARVRHDFAPEIVSAYARKELAIERDTVDAESAAVRSGDNWYALSYRCRLSPGHGAVVAFDFAAGERLTPARVEELGLPVGK